jgi:hypothetical protein
VAAHTRNQPTVPQTVPVVILGTDAVLAALPATPVQLAHACMRAGFANVIPASWGDELIAGAMLDRLQRFGNGPAIQCSCPIVAHRLLTVGGDLRPVMLPLVSPPVAIARYVRALARPARARITYVGACPGAIDDAIDIRISADAMMSMLAERDIVLEEQPRVFEAIIPPDRRRYCSQPGGVPAAEALWSTQGSRTLVEIEGDDFVTEIAQHLLTGKTILIDASTRLGCACSGAVAGIRQPRTQVAAIEPPRATAPIVEESPPIDLDLPIPAFPRAPVDVVATAAASLPVQIATPPRGADAVPTNRQDPTRASGPASKQRSSRPGGPAAPRSVLSAIPPIRDNQGKSLPRAYVIRRRSSLRSTGTPTDTAETETKAPQQPPEPISTPPETSPDNGDALPTLTPLSVQAAPSAIPSVVSNSQIEERATPSFAAPVPTTKPIAVASLSHDALEILRFAPHTSAKLSVPEPRPAPSVSPSTHRRAVATAARSNPAPSFHPEHFNMPSPLPTMSRAIMVFALIAVFVIAAGASAVVNLIVERSAATPAAASTPP